MTECEAYSVPNGRGQVECKCGHKFKTLVNYKRDLPSIDAEVEEHMADMARKYHLAAGPDMLHA